MNKISRYSPYFIYTLLCLIQLVLVAASWVLAPFLALYSVIKGVDTLQPIIIIAYSKIYNYHTRVDNHHHRLS